MTLKHEEEKSYHGTTMQTDSTKKVNGWTVPWTIADIFSKSPLLCLTYHALGTPFDLAAPVGVTIGAILSPIPYFAKVPFWQMAANGGIIAGVVAMDAGLIALIMQLRKETNESPTEANKKMLERQQNIATNYKIRALDAGTYVGAMSGALLMRFRGGPTSLGLKPGPLGVLQALTLGASVGGMLVLDYIVGVRGDTFTRVKASPAE